jgi:hypothetical protein
MKCGNTAKLSLFRGVALIGRERPPTHLASVRHMTQHMRIRWMWSVRVEDHDTKRTWRGSFARYSYRCFSSRNFLKWRKIRYCQFYNNTERRAKVSDALVLNNTNPPTEHGFTDLLRTFTITLRPRSTTANTLDIFPQRIGVFRISPIIKMKRKHFPK